MPARLRRLLIILGMHQFTVCLLAAFLSWAVVPADAHAQAGSLTGRVVDAQGAPVANVTVQALRDRQLVRATLTDSEGRYVLANLEPDTYTVVARRIGYTAQRIENLRVESAPPTSWDVALAVVATSLNQVVVSASRSPEKILDAPASVSVVPTQEVEERPSLTAADHLRAQPGVDVSSGGLVQSNIVARGFNNAFSGAMLMLQDNRFSSVPSLRVNVPLLFPAVNEDIERIEVLLGPAAALYGPNSAAGVLHIITKSPFTSQGTTLTIDAGERSVFRTSGRHASTFGEKFGIKLSGEFLQGDDWRYVDLAEPATVLRPTGAIVGGVGVRQAVANARDFDVSKWSAEARMDLRPRPGVEWINTFGWTHAGSYIEITGANGAAQAKNWNYGTAQSRFRWNRTFAQVFYNFSDSGNEDSLDTRGTFLLRNGVPIVDQSRVLSAQLQQAIDFGERQRFIVGGDYIFTNPRTGGTINGRNEEIDEVTEIGGYVHSVTRLSRLFEFVGALRFDSHTEMEENFVSPRAALVFKPTATQNLRLTYNRAYSTPANFSFFLDLPQATIPIGTTTSYTIRALGVPAEGFAYTPTSGAPSGLYMRSPFPVLGANPAGAPVALPHARVDAHSGLMYRTLVAGNQTAFVNALLAAGVTPSNAPTVFAALLGAAPPTSAQVGTTLRLFNPSGVGTPAGPFATVVTPAELLDVERLKASFNNTYELGYKGILGERFRLAIDGWFQRRENFITPAINVTPNAFMDPATLGAYIAGILTVQAQQGRVPAAAVGPLATQFTTSLAQVPVGTVVPDQVGVASDQGLTNRADLIFTYRNIDETIDLWGSDVAFDLLLDHRFTLLGTYSYVSETEFPDIPSGITSLRLNAPAHKATLTTRYRDEDRGWGAELRGRYMNTFSVNSGVYVGIVPVNAFVDASISYRIPAVGRGAIISLAATNLFDNRRASFIGVPEIGRMVMTRLQYRFGGQR